MEEDLAFANTRLSARKETKDIDDGEYSGVDSRQNWSKEVHRSIVVALLFARNRIGKHTLQGLFLQRDRPGLEQSTAEIERKQKVELGSAAHYCLFRVIQYIAALIYVETPEGKTDGCIAPRPESHYTYTIHRTWDIHWRPIVLEGCKTAPQRDERMQRAYVGVFALLHYWMVVFNLVES